MVSFVLLTSLKISKKYLSIGCLCLGSRLYKREYFANLEVIDGRSKMRRGEGSAMKRLKMDGQLMI